MNSTPFHRRQANSTAPQPHPAAGGPSRRSVLRGMAGAAASLAFVELATQLPAAVAATTAAATTQENAMSKIPLPLDESITESHVGSLYGPITRIRDAYGWATESFASDKYKPADHADWRQRMKAQVFAAMQYAPAKADFAAETVERVDCGKYIREKIYFNSTPELRIPAYVLVPKGLTGKAPAVVALHDHGGFYRWGKEKLVNLDSEHSTLTAFKKRAYAGQSYATDLAEQGYVVIVIDMFYWGERRMRTPQDPPTGPAETAADVMTFNSNRSKEEQLVARTIYTSGFTWAGLIFWDDIRTVDYLLSRPEVDPDRIGCVGLSVGAWRANHLMAFDERVKAGVAVCWLTSFHDIQPRHVIYTTGFTMLLPGLYRKLDMPDVVSLAAPRALLNINGAKDRLFPLETGVKPAYKTLEAVYAKVGAADRFKGHIHDTPHEFNAEMQQEAWAWLKRWV